MKHCPSAFPEAETVNLDYEGRAVARPDGKTVFIEGALGGERVSFRITREQKGFAEAEVQSILRPSEYRRRPPCPHFGVCGGCALQHLDDAAQTAVKQRIAEEQLARIGKVRPEQILPPIYGTAWRYRQRGRLAVSQQNGKLHLGFQAKKSHETADITRCPVLPEAMEATLPVLKQHLQPLAADLKLRFVEFALGENRFALNLGTAKPPKPFQTALLEEMRRILQKSGQNWQIWLQNGRQTPQLLLPEQDELPYYRLPDFNITMPFRPGDFTQVNAATNALMVARAVRLLDVQPEETVADLFCGLGNFTLPLSKHSRKVIAVEGLAALTERARRNAELNGCQGIEFATADLFAADKNTVAAWGKIDKMLLDPPRAGAYALIQALHAPYLPQRIVYVSCNPATFARDAAVLMGKGYRFTQFGVMNLFPQTAHIESIGVFELA
ncbi:MAG: 23S rRNA (uracil(1939)-C(5))-methyltransferase RlmD [Neisseria sp.]|nr:23S rRNA (uracil(1939)-C(5))-methyltransferase RlmD [Neisseria sp.]